MKNIFKVTAAKGKDNVTRLQLKQPDGITDFSLNDVGATEVKVSVCTRLNNAEINCVFTDNTVSIVFGDLDLPVGLYKPKLIYINSSNPDGVVIAGDSYDTEIILKMVC